MSLSSSKLSYLSKYGSQKIKVAEEYEVDDDLDRRKKKRKKTRKDKGNQRDSRKVSKELVVLKDLDSDDNLKPGEDQSQSGDDSEGQLVDLYSNALLEESYRQKNNTSERKPIRPDSHKLALKCEKDSKATITPKDELASSSETSEYVRPRRRHDSDDSEPAKPRRRHDSEPSEPVRPRSRHDSEPSEHARPRRRHDSEPSEPARPRRRHDSEDSEHAKPRRRHDSEDSEPERPRRRHDSEPSEPVRPRSRHDSDPSEPARPRRRHDSEDSEPVRRRQQHDSEPIPSDSERKEPVKLDGAGKRTEQNGKLKDVNILKDEKHFKVMSSGHRAGLQNSQEFQQAEQQLQAKKLQDLSALASLGKQETTYRDKKGKKVDKLEEYKEQQEKQLMKEASRRRQTEELREGIVQKRLKSQAIEEWQDIKTAPLARYADDEKLEALQRAAVREGDPMANQARRLSTDKSESFSEKVVNESKPYYKGPQPKPNRYDIPPGYRWDGIDRGNGFEDKVLALQSSKSQKKEEEYKWSVSDM